MTCPVAGFSTAMSGARPRWRPFVRGSCSTLATICPPLGVLTVRQEATGSPGRRNGPPPGRRRRRRGGEASRRPSGPRCAGPRRAVLPARARALDLVDDVLPSVTWPKTVCLPSSQGGCGGVMKNCEPFVFGPGVGHGEGARAILWSVDLVLERVAGAAGAGAGGVAALDHEVGDDAVEDEAVVEALAWRASRSWRRSSARPRRRARGRCRPASSAWWRWTCPAG